MTPPPPLRTFDFIIAGAGCAGLSLAYLMFQSGLLDSNRLLLLDTTDKVGNDRTWCFWEQSPGIFEPIVLKSWNHLRLAFPNRVLETDISPYSYKMIRSSDFYSFTLAKLQTHPNVTFLKQPVTGIDNHGPNASSLHTPEGSYHAPVIFNSILRYPLPLRPRNVFLWQHFKGWYIKSEFSVFQQQTATLMDFRTDQSKGTSFIYFLPISDKEALVEYTGFSRDIYEDAFYESQLSGYMEQHFPNMPFLIQEKEFGKIPMTDFSFKTGRKGLVNIGTAGGMTKGSSGYTFSFIQQQSREIVQRLQKGEILEKPYLHHKRRFDFYDSILLHVLDQHYMPGEALFEDLFSKNPIRRVLRFLNNESRFAEDLATIASLRTLPFLKAWLNRTGLLGNSA